MNHSKLSKSEYISWLSHPVTERLFKLLSDTREHKLKNALDITGGMERIALKAAHTKGYVEALELVLTAEVYDEQENENV